MGACRNIGTPLLVLLTLIVCCTCGLPGPAQADSGLEIGFGGVAVRRAMVEAASGAEWCYGASLGLGLVKSMGGSRCALVSKVELRVLDRRSAVDAYSQVAYHPCDLRVRLGVFYGQLGIAAVASRGPVSEIAALPAAEVGVFIGQVILVVSGGLGRFEADYEPLATERGCKYDMCYLGVLLRTGVPWQHPGRQ